MSQCPTCNRTWKSPADLDEHGNSQRNCMDLWHVLSPREGDVIEVTLETGGTYHKATVTKKRAVPAAFMACELEDGKIIKVDKNHTPSRWRLPPNEHDRPFRHEVLRGR